MHQIIFILQAFQSAFYEIKLLFSFVSSRNIVGYKPIAPQVCLARSEIN